MEGNNYEIGGGNGNGENIRWSEKLLQHNIHPPEDLREEEIFPRFIQRRLFALVPSLYAGQPES